METHPVGSVSLESPEEYKLRFELEVKWTTGQLFQGKQ